MPIRLHDLVGQKLTALNISLNIVKMESAASTDVQVKTRLDDSLKLVEETIESMRNVMMELRPTVLDDYGLPAVLRWPPKYARAGNVTVTLHTSPEVGRLTVADDGCGFDPTACHPLRAVMVGG